MKGKQMSHVLTTSAPSVTLPNGAANASSLRNLFRRMKDAYGQWTLRCETDHALSQLDDRLLEDIGLSRAHIESLYPRKAIADHDRWLLTVVPRHR